MIVEQMKERRRSKNTSVSLLAINGLSKDAVRNQCPGKKD